MTSTKDTSLSAGSHGDVLPGQKLCSRTSSYTVLEIMGEGCFGKVVKCQNDVTAETVAVKIIKKDLSDKETQHELSMLAAISVLDPEKSHVIKFLECFQTVGQTCFTFEMLDMDLYTLFDQQRTAMALKDIRTIAQQLFEALDALQGIGVVHGDIKPDNVMLVNHQQQPYKVKLIDFGLATFAANPLLVMQPCGFRSPECFLGLPVTGAIDMWGVSCVLAFMYLNNFIFPVSCDYSCMWIMVQLLGVPHSDVLERGYKSRTFFTVDESAGDPKWRLLKRAEFSSLHHYNIPQKMWYYPLNSIMDLIEINPKEGVSQKVDFVDLLINILTWDFTERLTPREALTHPFITVLPRAENSCSPVTPCKDSVLVDHGAVTDLAERPPTGMSHGEDAASPEQPQWTEEPPFSPTAEISPASTPPANEQEIAVSNRPSPSGSADCSPASKPTETIYSYASTSVTPCKDSVMVDHGAVTDLAERPPTGMSHGEDAASPEQPQWIEEPPFSPTAEISPALTPPSNEQEIAVSNRPSPSGSADCSPASIPTETIYSYASTSVTPCKDSVLVDHGAVTNLAERPPTSMSHGEDAASPEQPQWIEEPPFSPTAEISPALTPPSNEQEIAVSNRPSPSGSADCSPASIPTETIYSCVSTSVTPCKDSVLVDHGAVTNLAERPPTSMSHGEDAASPEQPQWTEVPPASQSAEISPASTPPANKQEIAVSNRPSPSGSADCSPASKSPETPQVTENGGWSNFWLRVGGAAIGGAVGAFAGFSLRNTVPRTGVVLGTAAGALLGILMTEGLLVKRSN